MKTLRQLYTEHDGKVSDKWGAYIDRYEQLFKPYRELKLINFLEVGIQNGGSLEIWAKYFTNAISIYGCDIDPRCAKLKFNDQRIQVIISDSKEIKVSCALHIIIDDGSHTSGDIIANIERLWPVLEYGGIYVIEDLHCSYMAGYNQDSRISSMEYLKSYIDDLTTAPSSIASIEFSHSLCILRKMPREKNDLSERLIVGKHKII